MGVNIMKKFFIILGIVIYVSSFVIAQNPVYKMIRVYGAFEDITNDRPVKVYYSENDFNKDKPLDCFRVILNFEKKNGKYEPRGVVTNADETEDNRKESSKYDKFKQSEREKIIYYKMVKNLLNNMDVISKEFDNLSNPTKVQADQNMITTESNPQISYKFDVLGRRIEKNVNGNIERYYYEGQQVIEVRDGNDQVIKEYVWGAGIDDIIRMYRRENGVMVPYYFHTNAQGSVTALTDQSGAVIERVKYDIHGNPSFIDYKTDPNTPTLRDYSIVDNDLLFQGHQYDYETGLYHWRARTYDPTMGRFLQTDPAGYKDSMNLYQAFGNNPVNYIDPMGEDVEILVGKPFVDYQGDWHKYGHIALRVFDPSSNKKYNIAYDFGRYAKTWGIANSKGQGILNIEKWPSYLNRELKERPLMTGYAIHTTADADQLIMAHFNALSSNKYSWPRDDIRKRYGINGLSVQTNRNYNALGFGRNTCVTIVLEGLKASGGEISEEVIDTLDHLYPKDVESDLEGFFLNKNSQIFERREYYKGSSFSTIVTTHDEQIKKIKSILEKEEEKRNSMWEEPKIK
jgi:RHS repeat-associated protein